MSLWLMTVVPNGGKLVCCTPVLSVVISFFSCESSHLDWVTKFVYEDDLAKFLAKQEGRYAPPPPSSGCYSFSH